MSVPQSHNVQAYCDKGLVNEVVVPLLRCSLPLSSICTRCGVVSRSHQPPIDVRSMSNSVLLYAAPAPLSKGLAYSLSARVLPVREQVHIDSTR